MDRPCSRVWWCHLSCESLYRKRHTDDESVLWWWYKHLVGVWKQSAYSPQPVHNTSLYTTIVIHQVVTVKCVDSHNCCGLGNALNDENSNNHGNQHSWGGTRPIFLYYCRSNNGRLYNIAKYGRAMLTYFHKILRHISVFLQQLLYRDYPHVLAVHMCVIGSLLVCYRFHNTLTTKTN